MKTVFGGIALYRYICKNPNYILTEMVNVEPYKAKNKIRIVTAASLFDGHDAAINIMRRIIQASGA